MNKNTHITIASYNKTAKEYDEAVADFDSLPSLVDFSLLMLKGGRILDLGCGPGQHSKIFAEKGFKVTGIDLSPEMVKIAKHKEPRATFEVMDISNMNFKSNSFDGIWASASLIHVGKSELLGVFKYLEKVLVENGILYMSFKEGKGEALFIDHRYNDTKKFYAYYSLEEINHLVSHTNFKIIKSYIIDKRLTYDTNRWIHIFCVKN